MGNDLFPISIPKRIAQECSDARHCDENNYAITLSYRRVTNVSIKITVDIQCEKHRVRLRMFQKLIEIR